MKIGCSRMLLIIFSSNKLISILTLLLMNRKNKIFLMNNQLNFNSNIQKNTFKISNLINFILNNYSLIYNLNNFNKIFRIIYLKIKINKIWKKICKFKNKKIIKKKILILMKLIMIMKNWMASSILKYLEFC